MRRPRSYTFTATVHAGGTIQVVPDTKFPIPDTGIPGYPNTRRFFKGVVEHDFLPSRMEFSPESAEHFAVLQCFVGAQSQWAVNEDGLTADILSKPGVITYSKVRRYLSLVVQVKNNSDQDRVFNMEFIGEEDVPDERGTKTEARA